MPNVAVRVVSIPMYGAIGVGPLVAGRTVIDGFVGTQIDSWLARTSLTIEWLSFTVLGYFFARTLVALVLDYEAFWGLPSRVTAFASLLAAEGTAGPLRTYVGAMGSDLPAMMHARALSKTGIASEILDWLHLTYACVRASWLAALITLACLAIEFLRRLAGAEDGLVVIGALAAVAAVAALLASLITVLVGRQVAGTVAELICRRTSPGSVASV